MSDSIKKFEEMEYFTNTTSTTHRKDMIVENVKTLYDIRSAIGRKKYGTTMERGDLNFVEWLQHLQEELMDATLYIEKLKFEYKENK